MAKESTFKNMVLVLSIVCLISSAIVGGIYALTKDPIDKAQSDKEKAAIAEVVPAFDNEPKLEVAVVNGTNVYPAKKGGEIVGYAIETSSIGFGGPIKLIVGFTPDGSIYNVAVVSASETPGLGDKINKNKSDFSLQFKGKNPENFKLAVKKDGGDVDAITASTITSRAFAKAVEQAYETFKINKK
jgi:electron transport complex, RnfABCDGE type, G subunit